jgi:surfeit locus 1 family protein
VYPNLVSVLLRRVKIVGLRFRPGLAPSIAAIAFIALTLSLGNWQTRRAEEKIEAARKLDEAMRQTVLSIPPAPVEAAGFEGRRVSARGRYIARATFFLDNRVFRGVAGYRVLTPLAIEGGDMHVLVDRGWIAAGDRSRLPTLSTPEGLHAVEGTAMMPSRRFIELAPEESSGSRRQNLVIEREQERLALKLQPFVIEQTSDAKDGLDRTRERPEAGVERHLSYALQWYSFAVLAAVLYVILNLRRTGSGSS